MKTFRDAAFLPLLLALGLPLPAVAAPSIPLPWAAGTKLTYQATTVEEHRTGDARQVTTTQAVTTVEITQAGPEGFVQAWSDAKPTVRIQGGGGDRAANEMAAQAMLSRLAELPVDVQLDAKGRFKGIRNWREIGARMRDALLPAAVAEQRKQVGGMGRTQAELEARVRPALARMTRQATLDATLGGNLAAYNAFTAPPANAGQPVRYEGTLRGPVPELEIPATGTIALATDEKQPDLATLHWTQDIDPLRGADAAWNLVAALTGQPAPADRSALPPGLVLRDEATVVLHRRTGVPQRVELTRQLEFADQRRRTTWTLVLRPNQ